MAIDIEDLEYEPWAKAVEDAGATDENYPDFVEVLQEELRNAEAAAIRTVQNELIDRGNGRYVDKGSGGKAHAVTVGGKTVTVSVAGWGETTNPSADDLLKMTKDPEAVALYNKHLQSSVYDPEDGALTKAAARFRAQQSARTSESLQAQCRAELSKIPRNDLTGKRQQTILKYTRMGMDPNGL